MVIMHLSDLHLGKSLKDFDLIDDQKYILNELLDIAKEKSVDAVLIAGDIYDKSIPSEAATNLLDDFLNKLYELKVKVFMISGNHDSDDRLNYGNRFFERSEIYIKSVFDGKLSKQTISDEYGEVDVYLLPYIKYTQVKHYFPEAEINNYEDAVRTVIESMTIDTTRRNVILSHQFVTGGSKDPEFAGSETITTINVGNIERINSACFDNFDYVALGHIHRAQIAGREAVRYAGSPLKYSLDEDTNDKTVPIVTLGAKGNINIELVPLKPMRELRHIKGELNTIMSKENIKYPDDYVYVTLTDENMIPGVMSIIQEEYPNAVKVEYENSHTKEVAQVDISQFTVTKTFPELITEFYHKMYGADITEEELKYINSVAKEVGIINEAD